MKTFLIDTETCGFHGIAVTIQWAERIGGKRGPTHLHHIWKEPIDSTLQLIEEFVDGCVVFHNARYDWFHLSKIYNMFRYMLDSGYVERSDTPISVRLDNLAHAEYQSQFGPCLKPRACVDTLILAQQGEYQSSLMDAKPVWIRRVPIGLVEPLRNLLEERTKVLPWVLFAKRKYPDAPRWGVSDCHDKNGDFDPAFQDLKLSFKPSNSLKHLSAFLCEHNVRHKYEDIGYATSPAELGYAPFVKLLTDESRDWLFEDKPTWPALLEEHIAHWYEDQAAQEYAEDDIVMLDKLYDYFGAPESDRDSMVACQVASCRLRGFAVDLDGAKSMLEDSMKIVGSARLNVDSYKQVLAFVAEALDDEEQFILANGCDQKVIDEIKMVHVLEEEEECDCDEGQLYHQEGAEISSRECPRCEGKGVVGPGPMPVVGRVAHIELIRKHKKRIQLFDKLILAKRAYPDFNVIGAKSGRMSGAGGLNFQGVDGGKDVRSLFTLADEGWVLSAGDYSSQEIAIAATVMQDDDLMDYLRSGMSFHGDFASELNETTYEDIMSTKDDDKRYKKGKSAVFLTLYGGTFETLARNCDVPVEVAKKSFNKMMQKYPKMAATKQAISDRLSSVVKSPEGKMVYKEIKDQFIESIYGFRRYFQTEYRIQKMIWDQMKEMPEEWQKLTLKVQRDRMNKERVQTITGAICSALSGACFSIQNKIVRAANNHVIQSTGRELTIGMQSAVWETQPQGIHPYRLVLMSIHDELAVVSLPECVEEIEQRIEAKVAEQVEKVELTSIEWFTGNLSWAEKGAGNNGRFIGWTPPEEILV